MIFSSITAGAPAMVTNFSAQICGILGEVGFLIFAIGGKQDSDGQGTNSSPYLKSPKPSSKATPEAPEA